MNKEIGIILLLILVVLVIANWNKLFGGIDKTGSTSSTQARSGVDANGNPVVIPTTELNCASVNGLTGTIKLGNQEFYCSGRFQCAPDGSITCANPTYYYYPYYLPTFRFRRGHGHHNGNGNGDGNGGNGNGGNTMQYGGIVPSATQSVVIPTNELDCAQVSGLTGTVKFGDHQFYCSGTFQCTPDSKITCRQPQYYYYPQYYYFTGFPFFRGGRGGHGVGGPGGPGSGTGGGTGPGTGGGGGSVGGGSNGGGGGGNGGGA